LNRQGIAKRHLAAFLESCLPRVSCLPPSAFTGQVFHRLAAKVTEEQLENAQISIARAAVERFDLSTCVLAFDTTNFDTHIATTTAGELARRVMPGANEAICAWLAGNSCQ